MGKHEASAPKRSVRRTLALRALRALHPAAHIVALVALHVVAFTVVDKTPLLALLFLR